MVSVTSNQRTTIMSTFEMYQQISKLMKLDAQAMGKEFFRKDDLKLVEVQI